MVQVHQFVTARLHEPGRHPALIEPDMQQGAPAPGAVGVDQFIDGCLQPLVGKRHLDDPPLPRPVGVLVEVLNRAPAAVGEMRAKGFDTLRGRTENLIDPGPVAGHRGADHLARQRKRHEHPFARNLSDAVAAPAQSGDFDFGRSGLRLGNTFFSGHG